MAVPPGRAPSAASARQVCRYQPPSGCGARFRRAMIRAAVSSPIVSSLRERPSYHDGDTETGKLGI